MEAESAHQREKQQFWIMTISSVILGGHEDTSEGRKLESPKKDHIFKRQKRWLPALPASLTARSSMSTTGRSLDPLYRYTVHINLARQSSTVRQQRRTGMKVQALIVQAPSTCFYVISKL